VKRPFFRRQNTAVAVGVVLFLAGSACLYDAWEGRGDKTPKLARPFAWW
jgi:hypothetical protein